MQLFLQQKHLLDNIAASENLAAHSYDSSSNEHDIKFHIFLCDKKNWDVKPGKLTVSQRKDVLLIEQLQRKKEENNYYTTLYG